MTCLNGSGVAGLTGGRLFTRTPEMGSLGGHAAHFAEVLGEFSSYPRWPISAGMDHRQPFVRRSISVTRVDVAAETSSVAGGQQIRAHQVLGRDRLGEQLELFHEGDRCRPAGLIDRTKAVGLL